MEKPNDSRDEDQLCVDVIDVGQGDSILLKGSDGTTVLVDSGPWYSSDQVLDHLDNRDINYLDHFVTTHFDADHIGGHSDVIEAYGSDRIGTVHAPHQEGVEPPDTKAMNQFKDSMIENGIKPNQIEEGDSFDLGDAEVDILNPSQEIDSTDRNENSVVLQVTQSDNSVLLAGDVEGEAEERLSGQYPEQLSAVDVAKVPHHGAENGFGSNSLAHIDSESLIISSSLNNQYYPDENEYDAHPHDEMLERVHEQVEDSDLYWTPFHGTTSTTIDDDGIQIETARGERTLSAADIVALKYYGRSNDLDNEQLTEIEQIDSADLPEEIPSWAEESAIVTTDQTVDETTEETATQSDEESTRKLPQTDEELFQVVQTYADEKDMSVKEVLQSMQKQAEEAVPATETNASEEITEAGEEGIRIREELRSMTIENGTGMSKSEGTDTHSDTGMEKSLSDR
ncbi:ComEC/Rec2 family competence protein [Halocatena marina]|uniref:ComEC/Rec2 family competence protein n=1 Tax=Halocatena marina TaxID=2934937 RepID=UPI00200C13ED|nr:MBL fold metallo-hydrolase [Halocatena marina]